MLWNQLAEAYLISAAIVAVGMTILWLVSLRMKDASIIDPFWSLGFTIITIITFIYTDGFIVRKIVILVLVLIWGLRLSIYLFWRNAGKDEDPRYTAMRRKHGEKFWWKSLLTVFYFQGFLMLVISAPLIFAQSGIASASLHWYEYIGIGIWLIGFIFQAGGDWQLARFKAQKQSNSSSNVLQSGFWKYTRHPNYFGESAIWWGYFLIAAGAPYGVLSVLSPILMTLLLLRVSGVSLLEKSLVQTKPQYAEYQRRTSAFLPWFPKSD